MPKKVGQTASRRKAGVGTRRVTQEHTHAQAAQGSGQRARSIPPAGPPARAWVLLICTARRRTRAQAAGCWESHTRPSLPTPCLSSGSHPLLLSLNACFLPPGRAPPTKCISSKCICHHSPSESEPREISLQHQMLPLCPEISICFPAEHYRL